MLPLILSGIRAVAVRAAASGARGAVAKKAAGSFLGSIPRRGALARMRSLAAAKAKVAISGRLIAPPDQAPQPQTIQPQQAPSNDLPKIEWGRSAFDAASSATSFAKAELPSPAILATAAFPPAQAAEHPSVFASIGEEPARAVELPKFGEVPSPPESAVAFAKSGAEPSIGADLSPVWSVPTATQAEAPQFDNRPAASVDFAIPSQAPASQSPSLPINFRSDSEGLSALQTPLSSMTQPDRDSDPFSKYTDLDKMATRPFVRSAAAFEQYRPPSLRGSFLDPAGSD